MRAAARGVDLAAAWLAVAIAAGCGAPQSGRLHVAVVDEASGEATPARVELLDAAGEAHVPASALRLSLQCLTAPPPEWARAWTDTDTLDNPHTGTQQFYVEAPFEIELPPGRYTLRAFKGLERRVARAEVEVAAGEAVHAELRLVRWADLPARGWYGADDHLHITRRSEADDRRIGRWMQGEDLQVANLLQMGTQVQFGVTPQHDFGDEGTYRENDHWLFAGQEHPRTHFLGHTIMLGARAPIDLRDTYIVYDETFREARRQGGVAGFAHFGRGPAERGLAIEAPRGLVDFVEVLQFGWPYYDVWYRLLDLGLRITPTAGTDFPCGPWSVPGRERFYTQVDAPFGRESWLEGIRRGRTFVTNGPLLELAVDGVGIGGERSLEAPGRVHVEGRARYDPERDALDGLELVRNSEAVPAPSRRVGPGELVLSSDVEVDAPSWIALRVRGEKVGETPVSPLGFPDWAVRIGRRIGDGADVWGREDWAAARGPRLAAAHTAPIWVRVAGRLPGDAADARHWLEQLDALEARLADDRIEAQAIWDWVPYSDGVSTEHLRRNRPALLRAIAEAREAWQQRAQPGAPASTSTGGTP